MRIILAIVLLTISHISFSSKAVSYTLEDRDRMIRLEEKYNSLQKELKTEIGSVKTEINSVRNEIKSVRNEMNSMRNEMNNMRDDFNNRFNLSFNFMIAGFSLLFTVIVAMFAYMVWDRRTAIKPVSERVEVIKEKYSNLILALKEFSKENKKLEAILKTYNLL